MISIMNPVKYREPQYEQVGHYSPTLRHIRYEYVSFILIDFWQGSRYITGFIYYSMIKLCENMAK